MNLLLGKLEYYDFRGIAINGLSAIFLAEKNIASINNHVFIQASIKYNVFQSSVLALFFFLIIVN